VTGRRGGRHQQLLDDLKEKKGCWKLKGEALARILWRSRLGRSYGPVFKTEYGMMMTTTMVLSRTQLSIICVGRIFIKPASLCERASVRTHNGDVTPQNCIFSWPNHC
jgi:hypothetical protein